MSGNEAYMEEALNEDVLRAVLEALNELEGEDGPAACWVKAVPRPHVGLIPSFLYGCLVNERVVTDFRPHGSCMGKNARSISAFGCSPRPI
ncbi:MAG: hypothetical protein K0R28_384 [Paenibacillus sp.]|nr:hypothetical protein [Paenibacillus sp.]